MRKDERGSGEVKMEVLGDMSSAEGKLGKCAPLGIKPTAGLDL